ncbi:MAG: ABC transporter ATP-binding protein [Clostridia bacterium]|nr:ABC transporter ATP-binding protein [Clostridia bacterium]
MIEIKNAVKSFAEYKAIDNISCSIECGSIFGIVGSNGAGKSTLLRMLCGVYSADSGEVMLDGKAVYDNPSAKEDIVFIADTPPVELGITLKNLAKEYAAYYENFDKDEYKTLIKIFSLDESMPLSSYSKGMLRQAMIIIALCCNTKYIVLDETMDGLDAVVRGLVKKKIYARVMDSNTTVIISSHSLRELEDFCDSLILIHKGSVVFERKLDELGSDYVKIQAAFKDDSAVEILKKMPEIIKCKKTGTVYSLTAKGAEEAIVAKLKGLNPLLLDVVPLSLEEIFAFELQELGYAVDIEEDELNSEEK